MNQNVPTIDQIKTACEALRGRANITPVWDVANFSEFTGDKDALAVNFKLEFLQHTGTFKIRGALTVVLNLNPEERGRGIVAASAGNHAIAVAWVAKNLGIDAKVVMPKTANPFRKAKCEALGATLHLVDSLGEAFDAANLIVEKEGRTLIHPFEGYYTSLGTATLGLEWLEQAPDLDVLLVPVGGGGLIGGIACAAKQIKPTIKIIGVEPEGADAIHRSYHSKKVERIPEIHTIADSLAPPMAREYSMKLIWKYVDDIVLITDAEMRAGMRFLFANLKFAMEPAGAATTAALLSPLKGKFGGQRVGALLCGSNIDAVSFCQFLKAD